MKNLVILSGIENPGVILLLLILFFGVIVAITIVIRNVLPGLKEKGGQINEEVAVQEDLDRILEPITDEETLKAMAEKTRNTDE